VAEILEHTTKPVELSESTKSREFVLERYNQAIRYYWKASAVNRRLYKWTRYLVVVLGAVVTLLASLSASEAVVEQWGRVITVTTPVLAALLTIIGGLSQSFQWGAAWQEMVLTAERLERDRDRIIVTRSEPALDMERLHQMVLQESEGFFARILGSMQVTPAAKDD
jgi:Protein of unknown function (DUF4231)